MNKVDGCLRNKNGRYYTVVHYVDSSSKRRTIERATGIAVKRGNKKLAQQILDERLNEYRNAYSLDVIAEKIYFEEYLEKWMGRIKKEVRENTYETYRAQMDNHVLPYFKQKHILLRNLKHRDIQQYYNYELEQGMSASSVKKYHANIHKALDEAVRDELIPANPSDKAILPKKQKSKINPYTAEEAESLFKAVEGTKMEVPVKLATMFGLRREEVLGLKWSAIDFSKRTLKINHTCVLVGNAAVNVNRTKNESSNRTLYMTDDMASYLKGVKKQQRENQLKQGEQYVYTDYVCIDEYGQQLKPNYISERFRETLKKNSLRHIRFHDLRHTCASLLLNHGYETADISKMLGHSTITTTVDIYGHIDEKRMRNIAEKMGSVLAI